MFGVRIISAYRELSHQLTRQQDHDELYSASIDGDKDETDSEKIKEHAMAQQRETAV